MYLYFFKKQFNPNMPITGLIVLLSNKLLTEKQIEYCKDILIVKRGQFSTVSTELAKEGIRITGRTDIGITEGDNINHFAGIEYIFSYFNNVPKENVFGLKEITEGKPTVFDYHTQYSQKIENSIKIYAEKVYSDVNFVSTNGSTRKWLIVKF